MRGDEHVRLEALVPLVHMLLASESLCAALRTRRRSPFVHPRHGKVVAKKGSLACSNNAEEWSSEDFQNESLPEIDVMEMYQDNRRDLR